MWEILPRNTICMIKNILLTGEKIYMKDYKNIKTDDHSIKPFWSWNDKLQSEELSEQIDRMKDAGINGFFMHARGGLITEYMSDEWFDAVENCLDKADEVGAQAWAYDENGWPSGFANGVVPSKNVDYQQKALRYIRECKENELPENILGYFDISGEKAVKLEKFESGCAVVYYIVNKYYTDTLNKEAIGCFIENTHEKYYEKFKERFGTSLKGFFTDEPQYLYIPWSSYIEPAFKSEYGYDLYENLILLFEDKENCLSFRSDYYNIVSKLFRENFIKQMYDWCSEHNCMLTGHMMSEDNIVAQMDRTAGVMSCYEYFHEPGIDWLGRYIESPLVPKQLGSVAKQLGRKTLTETFALCGWDVSLNELKWIAQWQLVNGVSTLCPHLEGYTIRGYRKRDYPASLFTQLPWFEEAYGHFADYMTKAGTLLDEGEDYSPVLVLHAMQSAYLLYNPEDTGAVNNYNNEFIKNITDISNEHILHHYGDEIIMKNYASVCGKEIKIGKCTYKSVVLPEIISITENTLLLLLSFAQNGGKIYAIKKKPEYVNGRKEEKLLMLNGYIEVCENAGELKQKISELDFANIKTAGNENGNIHYCRRDFENEELYYLVNLSIEEQSAEFELKGNKKIEAVNISNGEKTLLESKFDGNKTKVNLSFDSYGSFWLSVSESEETVADTKEYETVSLENKFEIVSSTPNCLTLDKCEYRINAGEWQEEKAVILIQDILLNEKKPCDFELKYKFEIEDVKKVSQLELCSETPEKYVFGINGKKVSFDDNGYFVDKSIRKCKIDSFVQNGINEITVSGRFTQSDNVYYVLFTPNVHESERNKLTYDTELESLYIIGNFSVNTDSDYTLGERRCIFAGKDFKIGEAVKTVDCSNITPQGYWFFSGKMSLAQKVNIEKRANVRYKISLKKLYSPAAKLYINGKDAGLFAFAPFEIDVTDLLLDGENEVVIKLLSGNRNLLGPHHRPYGESYFVGPDTFTDKPGWTDKGKEAWTDNYSFVLFGFEI